MSLSLSSCPVWLFAEGNSAGQRRLLGSTERKPGSAETAAEQRPGGCGLQRQCKHMDVINACPWHFVPTPHPLEWRQGPCCHFLCQAQLLTCQFRVLWWGRKQFHTRDRGLPLSGHGHVPRCQNWQVPRTGACPVNEFKPPPPWKDEDDLEHTWAAVDVGGLFFLQRMRKLRKLPPSFLFFSWPFADTDTNWQLEGGLKIDVAAAGRLQNPGSSPAGAHGFFVPSRTSAPPWSEGGPWMRKKSRVAVCCR